MILVKLSCSAKKSRSTCSRQRFSLLTFYHPLCSKLATFCQKRCALFYSCRYQWVQDFLENIGTILTFAVFGTIFNAIMIGFTLYAAFSLGWMPGLDNEEGGILRTLFFHKKHFQDLGAREFLLFGSIMSAVDPVTVIAVFNEIHVHAVLYERVKFITSNDFYCSNL